MRHTVIFLYNNGIKWYILETDSLRFAAMENNRLCGRFLHLKAGSGCHLCDGKFTWIQALALLMELDLAIGIGEDLPEIVALRRVGRLAGGGISHVETRPFDR